MTTLFDDMAARFAPTQPVELTIRQAHAFKKKPPRWDEKKGRQVQPAGCAVCGTAKTAIRHYGTTPSVNVFLAKDIQVYRSIKAAWEGELLRLLRLTELEPCERIVVEGVMCFPTRRRPDQGNHRFLLEKALGDALVTGGYLPDDTWDRYEFGGLNHAYEAGQAWTRVLLFPS